MIPAPSPALPRTAIHVLLWTALVALLLGSHASLHVCTGSCCAAVVAVAAPAPDPDGCGDEAACCCSAHEPGAPSRTERTEPTDRTSDTGDHVPPGGTVLRKGCCGAGCCVDLCLGIDDGPLPRRVVWEHGPDHVVAIVPPAPPAPFAVAAVEPQPGAPATGPPRPDRRTQLLASTILRL